MTLSDSISIKVATFFSVQICASLVSQSASATQLVGFCGAAFVYFVLGFTPTPDDQFNHRLIELIDLSIFANVASLTPRARQSLSERVK